MPVNALVDNFSVQQSAVGANQAAAAELRDIDKKDQSKKIDDRSSTQKVLEAKSAATASKEILTDLVSKLAGSGIKLEPEAFVAKAQRHVKDEHDLMFQSKENSSDSVDLTAVNQRIKAAKQLNQNNKDGKGGEGRDAQIDAQKIAGTLEEFSGAFVQLIVSGGTDIKKKTEKLEQQLRSEGFSENELLGLKQNIKNSIRTQIAGQIKESLLKRFMSKEKTLDWFLNDKQADKTIAFAFHSDKLGGWDFGGRNDSLQGTVDEQIRQVKSEVKDFVNDELKTALTKIHLGDPASDKEIKQLIELGLKSGFNPNQFMASWKQTMNNIGICPPPPEAYAQSMIGSGMSNSDSKKERTGYEYSSEDEKDLFTNQLRSIYMLRAIRGNFMTNLETSFKIRKLKNGLIKLGVSFADIERLQAEGRALARVKTLDMLKETFYERATLYELSGPAFTMIEGKIKSLLKNLERLGMDLTKTDLDSLRDQANYRMFDVSRNELDKTIMNYESERNPYYEKKMKLIIKLLKRIKEESKIDTDFDPEKRYAMNIAAA